MIKFATFFLAFLCKEICLLQASRFVERSERKREDICLSTIKNKTKILNIFLLLSFLKKLFEVFSHSNFLERLQSG